MSFNHMPVALVEVHHSNQAADTAAQAATITPEQERARNTIMKSVDGVFVVKQLALLCEAVRAVHRNVKFAVGRRCKSTFVDGFLVPSEVWVYFPGDQYCPIRLGYTDYSVQYSASNKFSVYSRHIKNDKFKEDREQYYMALTDSMDRALKNVKKYMRPYSPADVAGMSLDDFQSKLNNIRWKASSAYSDAFGDVTKHAAFAPEMRALITSGYQFNDATFGVAVKKMLETLDEQLAKQYEQHHGYYVQVREYMGEQVFDVIAVLDIKKASSKHVGVHHTYKAEELDSVDENLASRLAALSMLENNAFVEGLGHKVNATSYWVLK